MFLVPLTRRAEWLRSFDRLFDVDSLFGADKPASLPRTPALDVVESDQAYTVTLDLPGVAKESVKLQVQDNVLTLEARPSHRIQGQALHQEFSLVNFERQIPIPETYNAEQIKAELTQGVLRLHLPKAEAAKPKQITVAVG